jgi:hypothetical protein
VWRISISVDDESRKRNAVRLLDHVRRVSQCVVGVPVRLCIAGSPEPTVEFRPIAVPLRTNRKTIMTSIFRVGNAFYFADDLPAAIE